jgi:hypothetical protein
MTTLHVSHLSIQRSVRGFGRYRKLWNQIQGLAWFVLLAPGALLVWLLVDWVLLGLSAWLTGLVPTISEWPVVNLVLPLSHWPLVMTFGIVVGVTAWSLIRHAVKPQLERVRIDNEALFIESLHGELDNRLIGSLQLGDEVLAGAAGRQRLGHSAGLVEALSHRTAETIKSLSLKQLIDLRPAVRSVVFAACVAVVWSALLTLAQDQLKDQVDRLQDAWAAILDDLFPVEMVVTPGDIAVVRGRPVELGVNVIGARREHVKLIRRAIPAETTIEGNDGDASQTTPLLIGEIQVEPAETTDQLTLADDLAAFVISEADEDFVYQFEYGGRRTPEYTVRVGDLPEINAINYELVYPAYTGMPARTLVGRVPRLQALSGTSVLVSFAATTRLHPEMCYVQWADGEPQRISVNGRFGHFQFSVDRPDRATVYLTGIYGRGFEIEKPLTFEVEAQRDAAPIIRIIGIKEEELILFGGQAAGLPVVWLAEDDFAVTEVNFEYSIDTIDPLLQRPERKGTISRVFDPPLDRVRGRFQGMYADLTPPLAPGDRITFKLTARDNDVETGPNLGQSREVRIVIVSPDLSGFVDGSAGGFGMSKAAGLLAEIERVPRALDLLVAPKRTVRTEPEREAIKQDVKSRVAQEAQPPGNEDSVSNYFDLLSGRR